MDEDGAGGGDEGGGEGGYCGAEYGGEEVGEEVDIIGYEVLYQWAVHVPDKR